MKKLVVMLSLITYPAVNAMDDEPYHPTIPMINPGTGKGIWLPCPLR